MINFRSIYVIFSLVAMMCSTVEAGTLQVTIPDWFRGQLEVINCARRATIYKAFSRLRAPEMARAASSPRLVSELV